MEKTKVVRGGKRGRPERLNDHQKEMIVRKFNAGKTQSFLADEYGVSRATIQRVLQERREETE